MHEQIMSGKDRRSVGVGEDGGKLHLYIGGASEASSVGAAHRAAPTELASIFGSRTHTRRVYQLLGEGYL